jgi:molybdopterin converting factor small subunit
MKPTELQTLFYKETGIECVNSQGEFDIDYVSWLEKKLSTPKEEVKELGEMQILDRFINEIKSEFKDQNWDYLDFIKDRVIDSLSPDPSNTIEIDGEVAKRQFSDEDIEKMADEFLPNYLDLDTFKPKEIEFLKMAWWQGATVMQNKLNVSTKEKDSKGEELVEALEGQLEWLKEITELMAGALVVDHFTYRISELEALLTNLNKQP